MSTFNPGDKVMIVKDMLNTESHDTYMLKCATIERIDIEDREGFTIGLYEFPEYRFHPDELQLIGGSHD